MEPEFSAQAGALCQDSPKSLPPLLPRGLVQWVKGSGFPLEDCEPFLLGMGLICISRSIPLSLCGCESGLPDLSLSPWTPLLLLLGLPCPCITTNSPHQDDRLGVLAPGEEH